MPSVPLAKSQVPAKEMLLRGTSGFKSLKPVLPEGGISNTIKGALEHDIATITSKTTEPRLISNPELMELYKTFKCTLQNKKYSISEEANENLVKFLNEPSTHRVTKKKSIFMDRLIVIAKQAKRPLEIQKFTLGNKQWYDRYGLHHNSWFPQLMINGKMYSESFDVDSEIKEVISCLNDKFMCKVHKDVTRPVIKLPNPKKLLLGCFQLFTA